MSSRRDRRRQRQQPEPGPVGPERAREILDEQGLGAHELPVPGEGAAGHPVPDDPPAPLAEAGNRHAAADDSPTPTDQEYERAKLAGPEAETIRLAYEGLPRMPQTSIEIGLGPARGMRARMLMGQPAFEVAISEQEYIDREVAETRRQMEAGLKDPDGKRIERTEAYAQWRYRSFLQGEVASL